MPAREHYGLRTELVIPTGLRQDVFGPGAGVRLLRVIQEAVANARQHGRAQCVQVSFELENGSVRITVADDGGGLRPGAVGRSGRRVIMGCPLCASV